MNECLPINSVGGGIFPDHNPSSHQYEGTLHEKITGPSLCVLCCFSFTATRSSSINKLNLDTTGENYNAAVRDDLDGCTENRDIILEGHNSEPLNNNMMELCVIISSKNGVPLEHLVNLVESPRSSASHMSVCPECLCLVEEAMTAKRKVDFTEGKVRSLQLKILQQLGELEQLVLKSQEEMRKIQTVIKSADVSCLRFQLHKDKTKQIQIPNIAEQQSHSSVEMEVGDSNTVTTGRGDAALIFRQGVLEVTSEIVNIRNIRASLPTSGDLNDDSTLKIKTECDEQVQEHHDDLDLVEFNDGCEDILDDDPSNYSLSAPSSNLRRLRPRKMLENPKTEDMSSGGESVAVSEVPDEPIQKKKANNKGKIKLKASKKKKRARRPKKKVTKPPEVIRPFPVSKSIYGWDWVRKRSILFKCILCPNFKLKGTYNKKTVHIDQHLRTHETEEKNFSCELCPASFTNHQLFEFHRMSHYGFHKLICDHCKKRVPAPDIVKHLQAHEEIQSVIKCPNCSYACSKRKSYLYHMETHRLTKKECPMMCECDICSKKFSNMPKLLKHYEKMHENDVERITCPVANCSVTVLTGLALNRHNRAAHMESSCTICGKTLSNAGALSLHVKRKHEGETPFACPECPARFKYPRALNSHVIRVHGKEKYKCEKCDKEFMDISYYRSHLKVHEDDGYTCDQCGQMWPTPFGLKNHMISHSTEKQWTCEECGKCFKRQRGWKLHTKIHAGLKDWECSYCDKAFTRKEYLTCHLRIHTGDRPFVCDICGKDFNQSSALMVHKRNQHKNVDTAASTVEGQP